MSPRILILARSARKCSASRLKHHSIINSTQPLRAGETPGSIIILVKRDDAGPAGVRRVLGVEAVAGALFVLFVPEIAAFADALAQAGEGTDGGGVISQHIVRKEWRARRPL